jgi:2-alkyl-3-oxoalkanoate reductase
MNVFVTGGTGTLGRGAVRQLAREGHTVRALSRSDANDTALRDLGAEPVRGDLYDAGFLERALTGTDAVLHLASKIPNLSQIGKRAAWLETDRIRRDGTRLLVDAALKAGVTVFVYPSVVFLYPDGASNWLEADGTPPAPAEYLATTLDAEREVARFAASSPEARGVSLRLGGFYSPESGQTLEMLRFAHAGIAPMFGSDDGFVPTIWVNDASSAVVAAMKEAATGVYDVVDDEPLTRAEQREVLARVVGRRGLWRIPNLLAPLVLGVVADTLTRSQRVSNAKFKAATRWTPEVRSARDGWQRIASSLALTTRKGLPFWAMLGLAYLGLTGLLVGVWAQFAPRSFYDTFPGLGFAWVSLDGPFNEHLVRDVGGLNLALAILAVVALWRPRGFAVTFGLAAFTYQLPHFVYHLLHLGALPTTLERMLQTLMLTLSTLVPMGLLLEGIRRRDPEMRWTRRGTPRTE